MLRVCPLRFHSIVSLGLQQRVPVGASLLRCRVAASFHRAVKSRDQVTCTTHARPSSARSPRAAFFHAYLRLALARSALMSLSISSMASVLSPGLPQRLQSTQPTKISP
jgi:hypothetical protein